MTNRTPEEIARGMTIYHFEVAERLVRTASVEAKSAAEARDILKRWAYHQRGELAEDGGPIELSDSESVAATFRSIKNPAGLAVRSHLESGTP